MVLLCQTTSFGQSCEIDLGKDQRTCEFQDTLIGIPIGGMWNYLCADSTAIVSFEVLNDSSTLVTFSQCGSYTFEYSINDASCIASDTIQIDCENPAIVEYNVHVGMNLEYQNTSCQQDTSVSCSNFSILGEEPKPIWTFEPKSGSCSGNTFEVMLFDSMLNCLADSIVVNSFSHSGSFTGGTATEFFQDEILQQQDGEISSDIFYPILFNNISKGLDSLISQCPYPSQCFDETIYRECIDSIIYDTSQLEIPIHLGGEWQVLQNNQLLPLDSNNVFTIDSIEYFLNVSPSPQVYEATIDVLEINTNGDTVSLSNIVTFDFQWIENWTTDTVQHIDSLVILKDSCCTGGAIIHYTHDPVPTIPEYECPSFSVEFIPALIASKETSCNDSIYIVTIELSNGIPPYQYFGSMGTLVGNTFTSDSIPIDSLFYAFEFFDSGGCDVEVSEEICPCLWGGNIPVYELGRDDDCEFNSIGSVTVIEHPNDPNIYPYQYSIDGINFQDEPFFNGLSEGIYQLTVKDSFNCTVTNEIIVENDNFFNTGFDNTFTDLSACEGEEVLLEIGPSSQNIYVIWENGITAPNQTVSETGNYIANIYDLTLCTTYSDEFQVDIIPNPSINDIKIPNVFTPDSDGNNDSFGPVFTEEVSVSYYNMSIFNRWGKRVFHTTDENEKWQPKEKSPTDVYVYLLEMEIVNCFGEEIYFKDSGDLTLIR